MKCVRMGWSGLENLLIDRLRFAQSPVLVVLDGRLQGLRNKSRIGVGVGPLGRVFRLAAVFVLFSAATGTGIVAAYLIHSAHHFRHISR